MAQENIFLKINIVTKEQDYEIQNQNKNGVLYADGEKAQINIIESESIDKIYQHQTFKELVLILEIKYQSKWIEFSRSDEFRMAADGRNWKKNKKQLSLTYDGDSKMAFEYLKYFETSRNFKKINPQAQKQHLTFTSNLKLQYKDQSRILEKVQEQQQFDIKSIWFSQEAQDEFKRKFIEINSNSNLGKYEINKEYILQKQKLCLETQVFKLNVELEKIYLANNSIDVNIKEISSNGVEIKNVFVYVCYQFNIKVQSLKEATPIEIYDFKQVKQNCNQNYSEEVKLRIPISNNDIPQILELDNISCKHYIIIHVQFRKMLQSSFDIFFPIVLLQNEQRSEYVTKDYFKQQFSESLVEMVQSTDQYKPQFSQLLDYKLNQAKID